MCFLIVFKFFVSVSDEVLILSKILLRIIGGNGPSQLLLGARARVAPFKVYAYSVVLFVCVAALTGTNINPIYAAIYGAPVSFPFGFLVSFTLK